MEIEEARDESSEESSEESDDPLNLLLPTYQDLYDMLKSELSAEEKMKKGDLQLRNVIKARLKEAIKRAPIKIEKRQTIKSFERPKQIKHTDKHTRPKEFTFETEKKIKDYSKPN